MACPALASSPPASPYGNPEPAHDAEPITQGLCMHVEEHSFSGACGKKFGGRKPTCARGLKVRHLRPSLSLSLSLSLSPSPSLMSPT